MKTLFAAAALSVSSLIMVAPAVSASAEDVVWTAGSVQLSDYVDGSEVELAVEAARPVCKGHGNITGRRWTGSCRRAFEGTHFRVHVYCSEVGWKNGPWRRQTRDFSTWSTVRCGADGGVVLSAGWQPGWR